MKIYLVVPRQVLNTYREKLCEHAVSVVFVGTVMNDHFQHGNEASRFDVLCECHSIVVLPYPNGSIDDRMKFALNVMAALKKNLYLMHADFSMVRAELVGGKKDELLP